MSVVVRPRVPAGLYTQQCREEKTLPCIGCITCNKMCMPWLLGKSSHMETSCFYWCNSELETACSYWCNFVFVFSRFSTPSCWCTASQAVQQTDSIHRQLIQTADTDSIHRQHVQTANIDSICRHAQTAFADSIYRQHCGQWAAKGKPYQTRLHLQTGRRLLHQMCWSQLSCLAQRWGYPQHPTCQPRQLTSLSRVQAGTLPAGAATCR